MVYHFEVEGRPPRQENYSMWGRKAQFEPLKMLRIAAANIIHIPIVGYVGISVVFEFKGKQPQDLDNMLNGLLDGLQPAAPNAKPLLLWRQQAKNIKPVKAIAYESDTQVVEIFARKVHANQDKYYVTVYAL